jgi:hypothetical protein
MDYGRLETAHTRALAWLLGDHEHGFGFHLLEALLERLMALEDRTINGIQVNRVESEHSIFCGPQSADGSRIDVLAEGHWMESGNEAYWLLVIEAKIDAEEGEEQLSVYDAWIEGRHQPAEILRIFLTPDARESRTSSAKWKCLSFLDLASVFRRVSSRLTDKPGYHFLRYYLSGVLRDVCGLPVPISPHCQNPYIALDYLQSLLHR